MPIITIDNNIVHINVKKNERSMWPCLFIDESIVNKCVRAYLIDNTQFTNHGLGFDLSEDVFEPKDSGTSPTENNYPFESSQNSQHIIILFSKISSV